MSIHKDSNRARQTSIFSDTHLGVCKMQENDQQNSGEWLLTGKDRAGIPSESSKDLQYTGHFPFVRLCGKHVEVRFLSLSFQLFQGLPDVYDIFCNN